MRVQSDNETLEEFGARVSVFELRGVINFIGSNFITRSVAEADFQDFSLLSFHYKLPLILLSRSKISTIGGKFISFINNKDKTDICYIVFSGASYTSDSSKSPSYAIIQKEGSMQLSTVLLGKYYDKITSNNYTDIIRYLDYSLINVDKEKRVFKVRVKKNGKKIKIKR